ncbi:TetR/AcrR family transcriptional regulator C-terminal domain-containing protein [Pseudonocardia sp. RS11V-5]|uniref:TetR/AcrR family transcriptional regulator C-terminal domain-containing protein n=1 Tax=Pseudonocardia terrae TaxID=2905831 RepID=UPI001E61D046|nr:TetR/AcrR family transcriptional regulator C-terminal domain-containing protein [Pseudonocardia terrae]MCE3552607.1 TetR/AcrR family transcriptional regulator C-terminal domain-containing protein [Pseudonocardia terrae]
MAYTDVVEAIRARIAAGELAPGDRIPSTRQIVAEFGVAMATASKVIAALRQEGLVRVLPGVGTVVAGDAVAPEPELGRGRILRAALRIADGEGVDALSMRRVAAELGTGTMSLYRHVPGKEELLLLMRDAAFGEFPLPPVPPPGWRAQLEVSSRSLWALYRRHPWVARTTSMTRPYAGPNQMPYSEWNLRALTGLGLDDPTIFRLHLALFGYVHGAAASLESEAREEAETGVTLWQWIRARETENRAVMESGSFPNSVRVFLHAGPGFDLDTIFETGLARMLDGIAALTGRTGER